MQKTAVLPQLGGRSADVVVLGAGIAGLVAAYELESRGHRVVVVEGSERIGGRVYTHRFGNADTGPYAELGAMRIPADHRLTLRYVEKLGLKSALRPFHTLLSDDHNCLPAGGRFVRVKDAAGPLVADLRRQVPTDSYRGTTLLFGAWLTAAVQAIGPASLRDAFRSDLAQLLRRADRIDLAPYMHGARADRVDLGGAFRDHPELLSGSSPRLYGFIDGLLLETGSGLKCLRGGMGRIADRLAERIRGPVLTRREVVSLHVAEEAVGLVLRQGRRTTLHRCPVVLCTLPFSVLRRMTLTGLDADKHEVINGIEYGAATKVALHCREAFWMREGIHGGGSATGGRTRQTYYPEPEGPNGEAVLLGSYAIADDADLLGQFPAEARHAALIDELAPLHPELKEPGTVLGGAGIAWASHRWSMGCTALRWRWGGDTAHRAEERRRAARPQGRLFFAGEHCSSTPAWINGAIESALGAVRAVDSAVRVVR